MSDNSAIEWTDATWNPIRARNRKTGKIGWHCTHESEGCRFCYAEGFNKRLGTGLPYKPGHESDIDIYLDEVMLQIPLAWKRPRRIFTLSMSDLFADFVKEEWVRQMFDVMVRCPQHTFQVLTKRPARMYRQVQAMWDVPPPNVWLGVSVEDQANAESRIDLLLRTPAAKRFLSCEPIIGEIDLSPWLWGRDTPCDGCPRDADCGCGFSTRRELGLPSIDWVIAGGESGPKARPMHPAWARSLRDQCKAAIARAADQCKERKPGKYDGDQLFSEDLW